MSGQELPSSKELVDALREACQQCPCTVRERDSGHRIDCGVPRWQEILERCVANRPQSATEVGHAIEDLETLCDYAYDNGFHELGYDPVKVVRDAVAAQQPPAAQEIKTAFADLRWYCQDLTRYDKALDVLEAAISTVQPPLDDTDLLRRIAINGILPDELQAELEARLGQTKEEVPRV